jgi:hypothetical protein
LNIFLKAINKAISMLFIENNIEDKYKNLKKMFAFQKNIIILVSEMKVKLANKKFFDFFNVKDLDEFNDNRNLFEEIEGENLSDLDPEKVFNYLVENSEDIQKIKIKNNKNQYRNLIVTINNVPHSDTNDYTMLFVDITKLEKQNTIEKSIVDNVIDLDELDDKLINLDSIDLSTPDKNEIFNELKNIYKKKESLIFFNFYKGLTISHTGKIINISNDKITFKVPKLQALAMNNEKSTFIYSKLLKRDIISKYIEGNLLDNNIITLGSFSYINTSPRYRKLIRIENEDNISIKLTNRDTIINGKIIDISLNSIALKINEFPKNISKKTIFNISFHLLIDNGKKSIKVEGKIIKVKKINTNKYKVVLSTFLDKTNEDYIRKYISSKQVNLIHELKNRVKF